MHDTAGVTSRYMIEMELPPDVYYSWSYLLMYDPDEVTSRCMLQLELSPDI